MLRRGSARTLAGITAVERFVETAAIATEPTTPSADGRPPPTSDASTALMLTAEILNREHIPWMLVGSGATALRGARIAPRDLDITVSAAADVSRAALLMPASEADFDQDPGLEWFSSVSSPTLSFGGHPEEWTFGRWIVDGFRVEIAHILSPRTAALYLETRSPLSWRDREVLAIPYQVQQLCEV